MTYDIKSTALSDAPELSRMHQKCFDEGWSAPALRDLMETPGCFAIQVIDPEENEDQSKGFLLSRQGADEVEILTLCVDPNARQKGIARQLVGHLIAASVASAATSIFLEVAANNVAATALYRSLGFAEVARRKNYYRPSSHPSGLDALIMALDISQETGLKM